MNYRGALIRLERNRQNWSQEGLCKGICTVSYLSKIENGKADPSEEILRLLLDRLDLHTDPMLEAEASRTIETAYELLFIGCNDELKLLLSTQNTEQYRATASGLDFLLLQEFIGARHPLDAELEPCMNTRQLALQRIMQSRHHEALALHPNAFTYRMAGEHTYHNGNHAASLEYLRTGYDLAAQEGAPRLMLYCKLFIGNIYCNRHDMVSMMQHYAVAKRLAVVLKEDALLDSINYNTAAAQIENGQFEEAYAYFSKQGKQDIMSLHKLAICCEKTGRTDEAFDALARADQIQSVYPDTALARLICAVVRYRLEHSDYLKEDAYSRLLLDCFEQCQQSLSIGFAAFHLPWVIEWFKATRQYKRAYELITSFPGMCHLI